MDLSRLECCSVQEITCTSQMSPEYVLDYICERYTRTLWDMGETSRKWRRFPGYFIFTGLIKNKAYNVDEVRCSTSQIKLAKYIQKNRLGRITTVRANYNRENEPEHLVKVWLWSPAPKTLQKWYLKRHPDVKYQGETY